MQRPEVQAKVTDLKQHTGPNEIGYKFMKDGTPPQEAPPALNSNYAVYMVCLIAGRLPPYNPKP